MTLCRGIWGGLRTSNGVVRELVVLVLGLEPLHAQKVQVPLVSVLLELADLQTSGRRAVATADASVVRVSLADTSDGSEASLLLAAGEGVGNVLELGSNDVVGRVAGMGVVGAVLEGGGELEEGEESKEHGGDALGLAEGSHCEEGGNMNTLSKDEIKRHGSNESERATVGVVI